MKLVKTTQTDLIDLNAELFLTERGFTDSIKWDSIKIDNEMFKLQKYSYKNKKWILAQSFETPIELRLYVTEDRYEDTLLSNERAEYMINGKHFELTEWEQGMIDFQKELEEYEKIMNQ